MTVCWLFPHKTGPWRTDGQSCYINIAKTLNLVTEWMTFVFDTTIWSRQISYKHHKRHKMILINNDSRLPSVPVGIARRVFLNDRAAQITAASTAGSLSFGPGRQVLRRNFVTISSTARSSFIFHCYDYHWHSTANATNERITTWSLILLIRHNQVRTARGIQHAH